MKVDTIFFSPPPLRVHEARAWRMLFYIFFFYVYLQMSGAAFQLDIPSYASSMIDMLLMLLSVSILPSL